MITNKVHQELIGMSYRDIVDHLEIDDDQGDCCGFANCDITDIPDDVNKAYLVLKDCVEINYDDGCDVERVVLNFVFNDGNNGEVILGYELTAGSGSGWAYGAYVTLSLGDKLLAEASW